MHDMDDGIAIVGRWRPVAHDARVTFLQTFGRLLLDHPNFTVPIMAAAAGVANLKGHPEWMGELHAPAAPAAITADIILADEGGLSKLLVSVSALGHELLLSFVVYCVYSRIFEDADAVRAAHCVVIACLGEERGRAYAVKNQRRVKEALIRRANALA